MRLSLCLARPGLHTLGGKEANRRACALVFEKFAFAALQIDAQSRSADGTLDSTQGTSWHMC